MAGVLGLICLGNVHGPVRADGNAGTCPSGGASCYQKGYAGLTPLEQAGRDTWYFWTGGGIQDGHVIGDQVLWRKLAVLSHGELDLLQAIDSRYRTVRFKKFGVLNDPDCREVSAPDPYGLYLDICDSPDVPRPMERDADGNEVIVDGKPVRLDVGEPTGIVGLRKFPNPNFDPAKWNLRRYQKDAASVEPPYLIGVACGFCHIGLSPVNPPANPEHSAWSNLEPGIGNQYLREQLFHMAKYPESKVPGPHDFFRQAADAQSPGTSDTSEVDTDHINNSSVINNVVSLNLRPKHLERTEDGVEREIYHVLIDGADSIGAACLDNPTELAGRNDTACAALRGYLNIGLCGEYWTSLHDPVFGTVPQKPFDPKVARKVSPDCNAAWSATEVKLGGLEAFLRTLKPLKLEDARGGKQFIPADSAILDRGRAVFAEHCATCHSSRPAKPFAHFEDGDFLSDDKRHSVAEIGTNAARALAPNATAGHIWSHFSSTTYQSLDPVTIDHLVNPYHPEKTLKPMTVSGGLGYYRTPTLANVWATAPFLHNNSVGVFNGDPSVKGRLSAYESGMEQLLGIAPRQGLGSIRRTTTASRLYFREGGYVCVPKGTPIDVITNVGAVAPPMLRRNNPFTASVCLMSGMGLLNSFYLRKDVSADFVQDRGHTFGSDLPLEDKRALIEYMKLF